MIIGTQTNDNKLLFDKNTMKSDKYYTKISNIKYKALMIDVDGTLIDYAKTALPTPKVSSAVKKAQKYMHIGVATSRGYEETVQIAKHLDLKGPSILNGGALIVDFEDGKTLWEKPIPSNIAKKVADVFKSNMDMDYLDNKEGYTEYLNNRGQRKVFNLYCPAQNESTAQKILKELSGYPEISAVYVPSWTRGKFDVSVYQSLATKQHGIFEVAKLLNIAPKEFIVIGDGYNDFPLLESAGLSIAMGNAVQDLKSIADFIAPSVYEDGVAWAINELILKSKH